MKFIGQYIQYLISRFRNDVYFEAVPNGDIEAGKSLGLDANNKLVKAAGGTGGSGVTLVDNDTSTTFSGTTTVTVQGDEVQSFQNGANNVLLNIGSAITTASNFSISTDPVTSLEGGTVFKIGTPHDSSSKNFFAGDFAGESGKRATNDNSIAFVSNLAGNMEGNSKIIVNVEAPYDNSSTGDGNVALTHEHTVNGNGSSNSSGITVTISNFSLDGYEPKRKANVNVTVNPSTMANAIATAQSLSNHSGSQKFHAIRIKHTSSDGNTTHGSEFTSNEFFYDGAQVMPTGTNAVISLTSNQTKYLSNILYYKSLSWTVSGSNIQNISRDTRDNVNDVIVEFTNGITTESTNEISALLSDNANNSVNDDTNSYTTNWTLKNNIYGKNIIASGRLKQVNGGLAANMTTPTESATDSARIINSYNSSSTLLSEDFKDENFRLPEHTKGTWNTNSGGNPSTTTLASYSVSTQNNASLTASHQTTKDLALQVYSSGTKFKLQHPANVGTLAANPSQDKFSGSAVTADVKYYRYFVFSGSVGEFLIDIAGITRSQYKTARSSGHIDVKFSRPGIDNTFVPLDPDVGFNSGTANNSCWNGDNNITNQGSASYISPTSTFKCSFGTASQVFVIEITLSSSFTSNSITNLTVS